MMNVISDRDSNKKYHILIAEDVSSNRILLEAYLKNSDISFEFAENGQIAVDLFEAKNFDLILMDIFMPVMSGQEATKKIREIEHENHVSKSIPIVALTAHTIVGMEDSFASAGFTSYLTKPVRKRALVQYLDSILREERVALEFRGQGELSETHEEEQNNTDLIHSWHLEELALEALDTKNLIESFAGAEDFFEATLGKIKSEGEGHLEEIKKAINDKRMYDLEFSVHALRGSLKYFSNDLFHTLSLFEKDIRSGRKIHLKKTVDLIESQLKSIYRDIEKIMDRISVPVS